jgi:hypothetical protein
MGDTMHFGVPRWVSGLLPQHQDQHGQQEKGGEQCADDPPFRMRHAKTSHTDQRTHDAHRFAASATSGNDSTSLS